MWKRTYFALMLMMIIGLLFTGCGKQPGAEVVGPYDTPIFTGFENIVGNATEFEIGANKYGRPVFVDREAAYGLMKEKCADGIAFMQEQYSDLPYFSKANLGAYSSHVDETDFSKTSDDVMKQAAFIAVFYDIYENSSLDF